MLKEWAWFSVPEFSSFFQLEQAERRVTRGRGRDSERRRKRKTERADGPVLPKEELEPKKIRGADAVLSQGGTPPAAGTDCSHNGVGVSEEEGRHQVVWGCLQGR